MEILHGNAIVGQSGGPTAAINATLAGVIRGALNEIAAGGAISRLFGMRNGVDGLLREDIVELDTLFAPDENGSYTESTANPAMTKHTFSMMHILGEGWGCCWCCWLVWILLLVIVVLLFWIWRIRRKMNKQVDTLEEYEQVLTAHGLLVDGELVEHAIS